ncbi:GNAT family N-acetyltransferase [uncultured Mucilaginibacter sp.]|uniref:GNAT family N-acetyltransferase n=1 Tax=uncultured Mucilaginibacter sp. TaxID=797541 RepID=UPI002611829D|nr:GNAT family N-acetyltransferase [uncultured Mucilaginibacter sp.]
MENKITVNEESHQFEMQTPEGLALIAYEMDSNVMNIMHTEVPEAMEGQGIASDLAKFALDYARENQMKVKNYCRFVQVFLHRHPEYQDLIVKP